MADENVGVWRDLNTGVDPAWAFPLDADGANDGAGTPAEPITTRLDGPNGLPWFEGLEDPYWPTGLTSSAEPSYPVEDVGASPIVGAYEPAVRTRGPVVAWGHEPSGGTWGDQAVGRIMRFPANIPERYDANGVSVGSYMDDLAASIQNSNMSPVTDDMVISNLLDYPG